MCIRGWLIARPPHDGAPSIVGIVLRSTDYGVVYLRVATAAFSEGRRVIRFDDEPQTGQFVVVSDLEGWRMCELAAVPLALGHTEFVALGALRPHGVLLVVGHPKPLFKQLLYRLSQACSCRGYES